MMAESYRNAAGEEKKARVYDFLGTCDQEDFYIMFDSTCFNEISKDYMRATVRRLTDQGTIDEEQARAVRNTYAMLFEDMTAKEISET
jgi:hypothetical protein